VAAVREEAKKQGLTVWEIEVSSRDDIIQVTPTITRKAADAIFAPPDSLVTDSIEIIVAQAIKERLPLIPTLLANVKRGCLATYAANYFALGQQGVGIAHKVLRGAKPSELPIEQPEKLSLVVNLKTAKAIGLKIPREILLTADEVTE
jgi:putative ABC transport system substrate-binding protein